MSFLSFLDFLVFFVFFSFFAFFLSCFIFFLADSVRAPFICAATAAAKPFASALVAPALRYPFRSALEALTLAIDDAPDDDDHDDVSDPESEPEPDDSDESSDDEFSSFGGGSFAVGGGRTFFFRASFVFLILCFGAI